jgi:hypothetical protein
MRTPISIDFYIERDEEEIELRIEATYSPGCDAVPYLKNGDPGFPSEPAEVEILSATDDNGTEWELTEREEERVREKIEEEISEGYYDEY